jgi:hypothetical protein
MPIGTTLADVGALLGQPKIELPPGVIERMDILLRDNPQLFAEYATQDALIAVYYLHRLKDTIERLVGQNCLPLTSSGVSMALFKRTLRESDLDFRSVFGTELVPELCWDEQKGKLRTIQHDKPVEMRSIFAEFVIKTAHGGRGECFYAGPTPVSTFYDIDISSAYTVALSMLGLVDYENPRVSLNAEDYRGHVLGFALVEIPHCPEDVRFPVFPVEGSGQNLMFPRLGRSYCTAAEIEVALNLGYEIELLHGVIFPWLDETIRPFEPFVTTIRDERANHPKGSFDNEYIKLVGNGLFGKTGQGLKEKRVFDTGQLKSVALEESPITNELFFSFVMGFVRALIAELMNSVPRHRLIVSVTTDGFLTDAPLEEVDQTGPIARRFKAATECVAPGTSILEVKHRVSQILSARIRAQFTAVTDPDPSLPEKEQIVLAKGNVTPDIVLPDGETSKTQIKALQNTYMVDLYLNRTPESKTLMRPFVSLRQQWLDDLDIFRIERPVRLGLEFDMKRRPVNPRMVRVGQFEHIAFDTAPWEDLETAEQVRTTFAVWRRNHCLKTLEDWTHWQDFFAGAVKRRKVKQGGRVGIHRTAEGEAGVLRRLFLRAYAKETWGLTREMSYAKLAEWLTQEGYTTTATEIKNAARAKLVEDVVPLTTEVTRLLGVLKNRFSTLDLSKFVGEGDVARLQALTV